MNLVYSHTLNRKIIPNTHSFLKGFSIIIVTWNGLHHLKRFLPSVCKTEYNDFEIILADNASTDGTVEWVQEQFPEVKIASFDDNYGYTGGNNRAVPFAEKEILLFLNNDVEVNPDWLNGINTVFENDTSIAACQPKIRSFEQKDLFEYAGAAGGYLDRFGYPFCRGRVLDHVEQDAGQYNNSVTDLSWASGAALAIRKEVFCEMDGFDEDFEFHMEEIDLCWRTINAGHRIAYTPESKVFHLGGGSLPMGSPRKVYYNFRNSLYMLWKNLPASQLWYKLPFRILLDEVASLRALSTGNYPEFKAIQKAQFHFLKKLRMLHTKRKMQESRSAHRVLSPVSVIWNYFIRGRKTFTDIMK